MLAADADYRINAAGLAKGMMFVNGHGVGRHWLIVSPETGGQPTQQYYLVPRDWLRAENALVIFEEQAAQPTSVQIERRQRVSGTASRTAQRRTATLAGGRSALITDQLILFSYRSPLRQLTRSPSVVVELETGACARSAL